jgi:hypothetical protein
MLASVIINAVRFTLMDTAAATWSAAQLLANLNAAERKICALKPTAFTTLASLSIAAGVHQAMPAGATEIFDLYENVVSGRRARLVDRELLDEAYRFWPIATQEKDVQEWTQDPRSPIRYDVYPPNDGTGSVRALYGLIPTEIASAATAINLGDQYEEALKAFTLAESYAHNSAKQDMVKSDFYDKAGKAALGISTQGQLGAAPKAKTPGGA